MLFFSKKSARLVTSVFSTPPLGKRAITHDLFSVFRACLLINVIRTAKMCVRIITTFFGYTICYIVTKAEALELTYPLLHNLGTLESEKFAICFMVSDKRIYFYRCQFSLVGHGKMTGRLKDRSNC